MIGTAPTGPAWWLAVLATLESDLVEFDEALAECWVPPAVRAELCDQFRALALTHPADPDRAGLEQRTISDFGKVLEAEFRGGGDEAVADVIARSTTAMALWLALPDELRRFARLPVIG